MYNHDLEKQVRSDIKAIVSRCLHYAVYSVWSTFGKEDTWIQGSISLKMWADHQAKDTKIDFVIVLEASRIFNATDARAYVFAFLGHPSASLPGGESLVRANYELDPEHLYHVVARKLSVASLNFLVQAKNTAKFTGTTMGPESQQLSHCVLGSMGCLSTQ